MVKGLASLCVLALLLSPAPARAQRPDDPPSGPPLAERAAPGPARRQQLQRQLYARFMQRAAQRMELEPQQRQQLFRIMTDGEMQRREIAREARGVRQDLARAAQDPATPPAEYDRLMARMADLRRRDLDLWRAEQARLGEVLTPRQRAQFMAMRLEFFDRVQRLREQRREAAAPPPEQP